MPASSRRRLYKALSEIGYPRIDTNFRIERAPSKQRKPNRTIESRANLRSNEKDREESEIHIVRGNFTVEQLIKLVDNAPQIEWELGSKGETVNEAAKLTLRAQLVQRPADLNRKPGPFYANVVTWPILSALVLIALLFRIHIVVGLIGVLAALAIASNIFSLLVHPAGFVLFLVAIGIICLLFVLDAQRNRYLKTMQVVDSYLKSSPTLVDTVPSLWVKVLRHSPLNALITDWVISRIEIDHLREHISHGVDLRKHLSPTDPRRRTMQSEIDVQRHKLSVLEEVRQDFADKITQSAKDRIQDEVARKKAEHERLERTRQVNEEATKHHESLNQIAAEELEKVRKQERIDEWLEGSG